MIYIYKRCVRRCVNVVLVSLQKYPKKYSGEERVTQICIG